MEKLPQNASIHIPDQVSLDQALERTTHLAIGAHADDLEIMAFHGVTSCYQNSGLWFTGVVCTNGSGSARTGKYADFTSLDMQKIRVQEQNMAADMGEYSAMFQLGYTSAQVKGESDIEDALMEILLAAKPKIVYLHNLADKHPTHIASALVTLKCLRKLPVDLQPKAVYGCEVWRDLDWLSDDEKVILDVSGYDELTLDILQVFDSQISGGKRYDLATKGRRFANATYADAHQTDDFSQVTHAMDLTPLLKDTTLSPEEFIGAKIERFKEAVLTQLKMK